MNSELWIILVCKGVNVFLLIAIFFTEEKILGSFTRMFSNKFLSTLLRSDVNSLNIDKKACKLARSCRINENHLSTMAFVTSDIKHNSKRNQNSVPSIVPCISRSELHWPRFNIAQSVNADVLLYMVE